MNETRTREVIFTADGNLAAELAKEQIRKLQVTRAGNSFFAFRNGLRPLLSMAYDLC